MYGSTKLYIDQKLNPLGRKQMFLLATSSSNFRWAKGGGTARESGEEKKRQKRKGKEDEKREGNGNVRPDNIFLIIKIAGGFHMECEIR